MTNSERRTVRTTASAPGKLVLAGEYAVLDGAPAVAVAVNRRARVTVSRSGAAWHTVSSPHYSTATGRFEAQGEHFHWLTDSQDFAVVEHVWRALRLDCPAGLVLELDSSALSDPHTNVKLGVGSSAALAVALTAALAEAGEAGSDPFPAALGAHRCLQGGLGSGVDVACSFLGGLIEYSLDTAPGRRLDWPEGLLMAVFWVGTPSRTAERLARLEHSAKSPARSALAGEAAEVAAIWSGGSADALLEGYRHYVDALQQFSADYGLGIFDGGHAELAAAAEQAGLIYKPCGAGGGDTGVCLAVDADALAGFLAGASAGRRYCPDILMDSRGVVTVSESS